MRLHRPAAARGRTAIDWLDSRHTFSFGDYHDPAWMGFRGLRVINDDIIQPGSGFGTHPHRDMEIVTWVLSGALKHQDSTGGGGIVRPGDVQGMSAGGGIWHSEFNASEREPVRLLQIWIQPRRRGTTPRYGQASVPLAARRRRWAAVAGPDGAALRLGADAAVLDALLEPGQRLPYALAPGRHAWLQVATGRVEADGLALAEGDGLAVSDEAGLAVTAATAAEVLLFDLD
jgi:redox-sensitive bicupin YhaK (pirin superfamily)